MLEARQAPPDRLDLAQPAHIAVAEAVAADGQHHLRLDLGEAVDDAARAELRGAGGPDRPQAGRGDEGHERLGDVRQVGDDAVARADPEPLQPGARPRHLLAQLAEGDLELRAGLGMSDDGHRVGVLVAAHEVLGVVEPRARKPHRSRHLARGQHALERGVGAQLEELPDRPPEPLEVLHRPPPQIVVAREPLVAAALGELHEAADLRALTQVGGRLPQDLSDHLSSVASDDCWADSRIAGPARRGGDPGARRGGPPRGGQRALLQIDGRGDEPGLVPARRDQRDPRLPRHRQRRHRHAGQVPEGGERDHRVAGAAGVAAVIAGAASVGHDRKRGLEHQVDPALREPALPGGGAGGPALLGARDRRRRR